MPRSTGLAQPHQQRLLCGLGFHLNSCPAHRDTVNSRGGCDAEGPPQLVLAPAFGHCPVHQKATLDQLSPPVPPNGFGPGQRVVQKPQHPAKPWQYPSRGIPVKAQQSQRPSMEPPNALNTLPRLCRQQRVEPVRRWQLLGLLGPI